jgi:hypothetical protein
MPYLNTPNNGGVYKVWATLEEDYLEGCAALGVPNGLAVVDCGHDPGIAVHGFIPAESKTDNFKVKDTGPQEIDTYFYEYGTQARLDGLEVTWTDPVGATNRKWAYNAPALNVNHEAHVEAVTAGTHYIDIYDQPGCRVHSVKVDGGAVSYGARRVAVKVSGSQRELWVPIRVTCKTN